jgi:hypothetical protein
MLDLIISTVVTCRSMHLQLSLQVFYIFILLICLYILSLSCILFLLYIYICFFFSFLYVFVFLCIFTCILCTAALSFYIYILFLLLYGLSCPRRYEPIALLFLLFICFKAYNRLPVLKWLKGANAGDSVSTAFAGPLKNLSTSCSKTISG